MRTSLSIFLALAILSAAAAGQTPAASQQRPDDQDELRPIYDEIEEKMKGWNHPVLFG